jgi:hypothetical protein
MKPNPMTTSTQRQTFEYSRVLQFSTGEVSYRRMAPDGYPLYIDANNDPYAYLKRPNPPTPEAVARAQFVDKTYVWKEATKEAKPS